MIKAIYVEQFDAWWKLTIAEWTKILNSGIAGYGHELPPHPLARRPYFIKADRMGNSVSYWSKRKDILIYSPLDWDEEDYRFALDELAAERSLKPVPPPVARRRARATF